jgi:hypothetical protein
MIRRYLGAGLVVAAAAVGTALEVSPAAAQCSVFDRHPCQPTFCSVFQRRPCIPEPDYWIGQDLRLTIESRSEPSGEKSNDNSQPGAAPVAVGADLGGEAGNTDTDRSLDTIRAMFAALRACWVPPPEDEARPGMEMSVRFSFKRNGEIIGTPRVTYTTPDAPSDVRSLYHEAITQALARCTPMPFSKGLGGAVAGRPIAIRFVDNRKSQ